MKVVTQPTLSREQIAFRGDEIYERDIRPVVGDSDSDSGKYALIDVGTGAYEIDVDELTASDRLLARRPHAQVWLRQIGAPGARRFGSRPQAAGTTRP